MKRKLASLIFVCGAAIAMGQGVNRLPKAGMTALCLNPSSKWIPMWAGGGTGQAVPYQGLRVPLYGVNNGVPVPVPCDANGKLYGNDATAQAAAATAQATANAAQTAASTAQTTATAAQTAAATAQATANAAQTAASTAQTTATAAQTAAATAQATANAAQPAISVPAGCPAGKFQYPCVVAQVNQTGLTASIGGYPTAYTVPSNGAGWYQIECYESETRAATTSSTLPECNIAFTDQDSNSAGLNSANNVWVIGRNSGNSSNVVGTTNINTGGSSVLNVRVAAGSAIQYWNGSYSPYASSGATSMAYGFHLIITYKGP